MQNELDEGLYYDKRKAKHERSEYLCFERSRRKKKLGGTCVPPSFFLHPAFVFEVRKEKDRHKDHDACDDPKVPLFSHNGCGDCIHSKQ